MKPEPKFALGDQVQVKGAPHLGNLIVTDVWWIDNPRNTIGEPYWRVYAGPTRYDWTDSAHERDFIKVQP